MDNLVIVGGPPRSGTRFITNALNKHEDLHLHGEVYRKVLVAALKFFQTCDLHYGEVAAKQGTAGNRSGDSLWKSRKPALFFDIIRAGQKIADRGRPEEARYEGFKMPRAEQHWEHLLEVAGGYSFVYCLRPFESHYLSCVNRWPFKTISEVAEDYTASIAMAHKMLAQPDIRLATFCLEELEKSGRQHLVEVGEALHLRDVAAWADRIDPGRKANSAEDFVETKRVELTEEEQSFVRDHPALQDGYRDFWAAYWGGRASAGA